MARARARTRPPPLRARALLGVLERHGVKYVVIGGIATRIWGSPRNTDDLDVCADRTRANKKRLSAALTELDARFRPLGMEQGFAPPGGWDERSFDSMLNVAVTTHLGWMDVWFIPDGTDGYPDLAQRARLTDLGEGLVVWVADLGDIIRSKTAAGRNKDLAALDHLYELQRVRGDDDAQP